MQEQIINNTGMGGNSSPIRRLLELVDCVGPRGTTVLIAGESGTGKFSAAVAMKRGH